MYLHLSIPASLLAALLLVAVACAQEPPAAGFIVPRETFLRLLDLRRPEFAAVKAALDRGDTRAAEAAYAAWFRTRPLDTALLTDWSRLTRNPACSTAAADTILGGRIDDGYSVYQVPPAGLDWHGSPLSCVTRFPILGRFRYAWHHTGQRKYARFLVDHMEEYLRAYPIEQFAGTHTTEGWVSHTVVAKPWYWCMIPERLMEMAESVALLRGSPEVTDTELLDLLHRMYEECGYLSGEIKLWVDRRHNGGCAMIEALAMAGSVLADFAQAQRWLDYDAELALQYLQQSFYPDGMCVELTTAYSASVSVAVQRLAYALRERPAMAANQGRVGALIDCMVGLADPTGWLPSFGDLYAGTVDHYLDTRAAQWLGLDYALALAGRRREPAPPFLNWPAPGADQWCGYYAMRSGWDTAARYLAIDGGPWGTTHQHGDRLSFALTALGHKFIIDPSGTRYAANTPDSFISRQASGFLHNTVTVDGVDEFSAGNGVSEAKEPLAGRWETGPRHTLFAASYSFAPLKPVHWERRVLFAGGAYWLLQDVLSGELTEAAVEQNFQFEADLAVSFEGNRTIAAAADGTRLALVPLEEGLTPLLTVGDRAPHTSYWPDGKPKQVLCSEDGRDQVHGRGWTGRSGDKLLPAPAVTYTGTLRLPAVITVLLVPLAKGQSLADVPLVRQARQGATTRWELPLAEGPLQFDSRLDGCEVR